jgi:hypothetical protein
LLLRSWNHNFCSSRAISYFTSTTTRNREGALWVRGFRNRLRIGPKRRAYVRLLICVEGPNPRRPLSEFSSPCAQPQARNQPPSKKNKQEINPNSYIITPGASQFDPHSQPAKSLTRSPSVSCCIDWPTDPPARPPTRGCARASADWARHPATPHVPPLPGRVPPPPPRAIPFAAARRRGPLHEVRIYHPPLLALLFFPLPPSRFLWVCAPLWIRLGLD